MLQAPKPMDVTWMDAPVPALAPDVSAAKLHVLNLEPIKTRIGARWPRLSDLVHKLFEKALRRTQSPRDHFVLVAELSYVATFHGLSPEEAGLACTAVAREVCEMLFGQDNENVSVRSMIGSVPGPVAELTPKAAARMALSLETTGRETIVTSRAGRLEDSTLDWLIRAHAHAASLKHTIALYPAWELAKKKSQMLYLAMDSRNPLSRGPAGVSRALGPSPAVPEMEICVLRAAAAYGDRIERAGQICAINVGVSCETLCGLHSRIAYIQALKTASLSPAAPIFLKIEQIPPGMPVGRLSELAAMMAMPGVRVLLEFDQIRAIPTLNIRLGVAGIGAALPEHCEPGEAQLLCGMLRDRVREQRACSFL
jgi:hypothetical protein